MLKDLDFSNLEIVSAVKNISDMGDEKTVLLTITFVKEEDSYLHLTGIEELIHKTNLQDNGKYIKLQASYTKKTSNFVDLNSVVKVVFNHPEQKYRNVSRNETDASTLQLLQDIEFIETVFERSSKELKKVYM
ncbi:TPA: hypothetical protein OGU99_000445 [Escherichia coli]|nr:hypothetical protein [Escherichia coli]HCQ0858519.1 hypothetical protein [Escherichia coli]